MPVIVHGTELGRNSSSLSSNPFNQNLANSKICKVSCMSKAYSVLYIDQVELQLKTHAYIVRTQIW
jgi:hypothetical protein